MKGLRPKKWLLELGRKVVTFLVLACFCAATVPIPIATVAITDKDNSEPFPCQSCACGCKTAEQCWTSCCCFTPSERYAWAARNGVTPPPYAERPTKMEAVAAKKVISTESKNAARAKRKCCGAQAVIKTTVLEGSKSDCCVSKSKNACGSCRQAASPSPSKPSVASSVTKRKFVVSMYAMKCQGKSSSFTLLPWTILVSTTIVAMMECDFGPALAAKVPDPMPVFLQPDTPPPEQMFS